MKKVLWLSRHPMTAMQEKSLPNFVVGLGACQIVTENVTFPADSKDAVEGILALCQQHGAVGVAGVFPAHVAIRLHQRLANRKTLPWVAVPVSVPAPAVDGEVRGGGFVFSHWEVFY